MNERISLFKFKSVLSIADISSMLLEASYSNGKFSGFIIEKVTSNTIKGKHVYKYEKNSDVADPFGKITTNKIDQYVINNFYITDDFIEIFNPDRALSHLRRDLLKALNYECVIDNVLFDIRDVVESVTNIVNDSYVQTIELVTYNLLNSCEAKLSLRGGRALLSQLENFIPTDSFAIKKIVMLLSPEQEDTTLEITAKGNIKFSAAYIENSLINSVTEIIKKSVFEHNKHH